MRTKRYVWMQYALTTFGVFDTKQMNWAYEPRLTTSRWSARRLAKALNKGERQ